ncbi:hypothetical protein [Massilia varians]|nr:hypothetical protein [Massilia varians]
MLGVQLGAAWPRWKAPPTLISFASSFFAGPARRNTMAQAE